MTLCMSLDVEFQLNRQLFESTFSQFALLSKKSLEEELKHQGGLFVMDAMKVTPPFHGSGQAAAAKRAGQKSVKRNLDRLFIGKTLVGSRQITHVFGNRNAQGLPFSVPTVEKHPDVNRIYEQEKRAAKSRSGSRFRFKAEGLYVSRRKVDVIRKKEDPKIGWLPAGWNDAAGMLGMWAKVPAFVKRHINAPGHVVIDFKPTYLRIAIQNNVRYARRIGGLQRQVNFAMRKRIGAMQRQIPYLLKKAGRSLDR